MKSLFLFRRDLRLEDNTALNIALKNSTSVSTLFVFDPAQKNHPYFSERGFQFMVHSLKELSNAHKNIGGVLNTAVGKTIEVLDKALAENTFEQLYINLDYTPFARSRDNAIKTWAIKTV